MVMSADKFTRQAQEALQRSQELVRNYQHSQWDVEHALLALVALEDGLPERILRELGVDPGLVKSRLHQLLERAPKVVSGAHRRESAVRASTQAPSRGPRNALHKPLSPALLEGGRPALQGFA